jgi:hypothetical protein
MAVTMNLRVPLTIFAFLIGITAVRAQSAVPYGSELSLVATMESTHHEAKSGISSNRATAFLVGIADNTAWFITAMHTLQLRDGSSNPVITISFGNIFGPHAARLAGLVSESLDLGVLTVDLKGITLPSNLIQPKWRDPTLGETVQIIGHPPGNAWSLWSGTVTNAISCFERVSRFCTNSDSSLTTGFSGGPVFGSDGAIVGMHVEGGFEKEPVSTTLGNAPARQHHFGVAVKGSKILEQLQAWRVPLRWEVPPPFPIRFICPSDSEDTVASLDSSFPIRFRDSRSPDHVEAIQADSENVGSPRAAIVLDRGVPDGGEGNFTYRLIISREAEVRDYKLGLSAPDGRGGSAECKLSLRVRLTITQPADRELQTIGKCLNKTDRFAMVVANTKGNAALQCENCGVESPSLKKLVRLVLEGGPVGEEQRLSGDIDITGINDPADEVCASLKNRWDDIYSEFKLNRSSEPTMRNSQ